MLIEFTVGNYRSFREPVTISMEAAAISSEDKSVDKNNIISINKSVNLLTSAAIYGANASGKSNLTEALNLMRILVLNSSRESQADDAIDVQPFRLNEETLGKPGYFEVVFILEGQRFRYGFEVTRDAVIREWLFHTATIREGMLFTRENGVIKPNKRTFREGLQLEDRTRSNALYLSVVSQFNGPIAQKVVKWFGNLKLISGLDDRGYRGYTLRVFQNDSTRREQIVDLVRSFDIGIEGISVRKLDPNEVKLPKDLPDELKKYFMGSSGEFNEVKTQHTQFNGNGQPIGQVAFDLNDDESEGTKKLFFLAGPILDVLGAGRILIVDEMEARMHPLITCAVIRLFNSLETNPKRAQLIFTTHDTNLLDRNLLRRDQIWFTEKDSYGATHLYSLVEFKPRNDESFERNYLRGKYGAVPYLGDLNRIFIEEKSSTMEAPENAA